MFNKYNKQQIIQAWNAFLNDQPVDESAIGKEILESWKRSRAYGVNWRYVEKQILSKEELEERIESHRDMVDIATTMMETIYNAVKNSGFLVLLTDEEGYILKIIGDLDIYTKAQAQENILVEGANRSERYIGTNGIGISLVKDIPIQVWADEHYYEPHRHWTCSAAPIHDLDGRIIGCLNLSGPWHQAHLHSLGMVVAGANAIEKQMRIKNAYDQIYLINDQLTATLDAIPYGTILMDNQGIVTQINELAGSILKVSPREVIGKDIHRVIKYDRNIINLKSIGQNIYDKELVIDTPKVSGIRCSVSITIVKNAQGEKNGIVLTLKENRFIHQLINRMTAAHADYSFEDIIGDSEVMVKTKGYAKIASESHSTVLLLGESGTGKELFAQSIHNNSSRANGPFIAINCAALPRNLIESELFGYEGGAFTGAKKEGRPGKFELANGGTIFLDEIGDLPLDIQATLLRVLENREVTRLGGTKTIKIDVRVIAATNRNLEELVENKMYREDLYYRLNVFSIHIPPLRERKEDIHQLADFFLAKHKSKIQKEILGFEREIYKVFESYHWPGNVRELENVIERAVNITQYRYITLRDLPLKLQEKKIPINGENREGIITQKQNIIDFPIMTLKEIEVQAIINALKKNRGNVKKAAEDLGIGRRTIYRKFQEYQIDYTHYRNA